VCICCDMTKSKLLHLLGPENFIISPGRSGPSFLYRLETPHLLHIRPPLGRAREIHHPKVASLTVTLVSDPGVKSISTSSDRLPHLL
jgi:hypothetical protein